jgi:ferredoxin
VDCGACDPVCPVEAIYYTDDVPDEWAGYVFANVEFFEELGPPQGASAPGNLGRDHPVIKRERTVEAQQVRELAEVPGG